MCWDVCPCLATQCENPVFAVLLHQSDVGPCFLLLRPQGRCFPALLLLGARPQLSGQSDQMMLTGALSLEPADKAEGRIRANLGQHAIATVVLARLPQARGRGWSLPLSKHVPSSSCDSVIPSNKSHWTWCLLLTSRTLGDTGQPSVRSRSCVL